MFVTSLSHNLVVITVSLGSELDENYAQEEGYFDYQTDMFG